MGERRKRRKYVLVVDRRRKIAERDVRSSRNDNVNPPWENECTRLDVDERRHAKLCLTEGTLLDSAYSLSTIS